MDNLILKVCTKVLFTPIILFGLYVQFHGDFGPGGGFQAGVIVAAAFILYALVFSVEDCKVIMPLKLNYPSIYFFSLLIFDVFETPSYNKTNTAIPAVYMTTVSPKVSYPL